MVNFTVCDDCRYGMASYKAATVLFDLGTGTTPNFVAVHKNFSANLIQGGFTFKVGAQQYLVAASLGVSPPPPDSPIRTIYRPGPSNTGATGSTPAPRTQRPVARSGEGTFRPCSMTDSKPETRRVGR